MFKLLVLPWKDAGGTFDLNIQTNFVRAGPDEILAVIEAAMHEQDYARIEQGSAHEAVRVGFADSTGRRQVWYVLDDGLLLELNARFDSEYREGEPHQAASSVLARIVESVGFGLP